MKPTNLHNHTVTVNGVIFSHQDIHKVVDTFYYRVQQDPDLKVPFQSVHDWPEHIERLTHFWWIRFGGKPYMEGQYDPVTKHFFAGFNQQLLAKWLNLFHGVLQEHLNEDQSKLWTEISKRMGHALTMKNEMFREYYESEERDKK